MATLRSLEQVEAENAKMREEIEVHRLNMRNQFQHFYSHPHAKEAENADAKIPPQGSPSSHCFQILSDFHELDVRERLNTSSYVNVVFEDDELKAATLGMKINLADQTVYPRSFKLHNTVLNMVAKLWHCPLPQDFKTTGAFPGAGTVGSTEACLLAGLCLKFRWRKWYAKKNNLSEEQVRGLYPNIVMSTCFQAAWEKLFRYMDIQPKLVVPSKDTFQLTAEEVKKHVDDKTIGVVCILGNHYAGQYDPVWEINDMLLELNKEKGWEVGIHVDAASGGFVAPFQDNMPAWDFRLPTVLSISASGHKFGESVCGTGWVVWRQKEELSEHVAISVSYLGGHADSYTLNFSRPASGVFVQFYKFNRLGQSGYRSLTENRMTNARFLRSKLQEMKYEDGKPWFAMIDHIDKECCLPVVAARLNPELHLPFDDIDFQHVMQQHHWYVSGYHLSFHDPESEEVKPLFVDMSAQATMFRVVVKANITRPMIEHLVAAVAETLKDMQAIKDGFKQLHAPRSVRIRNNHRHVC